MEEMDEKKIIESATMRFRSTGLGQTTLYGNLDKISYKDGALVLEIQTVYPTRWRIRTAISFKALWKIIFSSMRIGIIAFVLGLRKRGWPETF